ncbi:Purine efflux pump PbuE [Ensifer sp. M14]|uniref:MFS transporter n=1 Tax=Ensifer sp. M14 TaxID=2203782 RepID=UPI000E2E2D61|nr:MFS transporter [Ensifer sp. M14]RDL52828.1 Purine efflux pump PbuE [Ensifer sp. M14]
MPSRLFLFALALAVYFVGATEFMLTAMLTPLALAFSTSPAAASWLVSGYALSYAIAAPILGILSDRIDRRRLLLASLVFFALDGVALTFAPTFEIAVALRILGGFASAALIPTTFALISETVPAERQAAAMGTAMLGMTLGIAFGPALAGLLTESFGWRAPFLATAGGCLLVFAVGLRVIPASAQHRVGVRFERAWFRNAAVLRPLLAKAGWNGAAVTAFLLTGEVLRQRYELDTGEVGLAVSAFGIGLGLGNLAIGPASRLTGREEVVLLGATVLVAVAVVLFLLTPLPLWSAILCLLAWGLALGLAAPASTAILARRAGARKGQVLALSESLNNVIILAALPAAAAMLGAFGPGGIVLVLAFGLALGVGLTAADLDRAR